MSNLIYAVNSPQFLIFQKNISAQTIVIISFTSGHYYFFEKLNIVEKNLYKLNCSDGKVSHTLKVDSEPPELRLKYLENFHWYRAQGSNHEPPA